MVDTSLRISKDLKARIDNAKALSGFSARETSQFLAWLLDNMPAVDVVELQRRVDALEIRLAQLEASQQSRAADVASCAS